MSAYTQRPMLLALTIEEKPQEVGSDVSKDECKFGDGSESIQAYGNGYAEGNDAEGRGRR